jgi:hypothetical protein
MFKDSPGKKVTEIQSQSISQEWLYAPEASATWEAMSRRNEV